MNINTLKDTLSIREEGIREWLNEHHPECFAEQKHLDAGTAERAYWHHGYMMALSDTLFALPECKVCD